MPVPNEAQRQKARDVIYALGIFECESMEPEKYVVLRDAIANALAEEGAANALAHITNMNALAVGQCPSCRVHPHKQACCQHCEDARIAAAELRGQAQGLEMATEKCRTQYEHWIEMRRNPNLPEGDKHFYDGKIVAAEFLLGSIRNLNPDPNYATTIAAEALERAARI